MSFSIKVGHVPFVEAAKIQKQQINQLILGWIAWLKVTELLVDHLDHLVEQYIFLTCNSLIFELVLLNDHPVLVKGLH